MAPTLDGSYMAAVRILVEICFCCMLCSSRVATASISLHEAGKHILAQALWDAKCEGFSERRDRCSRVAQGIELEPTQCKCSKRRLRIACELGENSL
jgi:hypothetical protein